MEHFLDYLWALEHFPYVKKELFLFCNYAIIYNESPWNYSIYLKTLFVDQFQFYSMWATLIKKGMDLFGNKSNQIFSGIHENDDKVCPISVYSAVLQGPFAPAWELCWKMNIQ